ncbi:hypothetical protein EPUS_03838 [Endocarpon pusillum Z07020]|uniref:Uncharacterized protein n=1 Tax=Endocarpon pusillum (strain Z07020 / HMAS-L-300199) TaxID=1263415 RepID=U1GNZ2_ENDPU|nr:uncharacterized protein EPUS_03838 [Endocarpon pusillum Z07020]ERF74023.1 hypothetical protein EPUS_03838 [Endocarpon pusillum Z07020]
MAPTRSPQMMKVTAGCSEERESKRHETEYVSSVCQSHIPDREIAGLYLLMAEIALYEPLPPPPILIVTNDIDTPSLIETRLARAVRIGSDATLDEINRIAVDDEEDTNSASKSVHVHHELIHPLWYSKRAKNLHFKKPDWLHPFLNRKMYLRDRFYKHL